MNRAWMSGLLLEPGQEEILAECAASVGEEFVWELLDDFRTYGPSHVTALRAALRAGEANALARAAHTLGSMALTLGFGTLGRVCRSLEASTRSGELHGADRLVQQVEAAFGSASEFAQEW